MAEEEARRAAEEARAKAEQERSKAEAKRAKATEALSGEMKEEVIRQQGLIYRVRGAAVPGGLVARHLRRDFRHRVRCAIPLLAALIELNRQEAFRGRRST
jgi:hypothetical protein